MSNVELMYAICFKKSVTAAGRAASMGKATGWGGVRVAGCEVRGAWGAVRIGNGGRRTAPGARGISVVKFRH